VGFVDAPADVVEQRNRAIGQITATYRAFGFEPLETPAIEDLRSLGKHLPDEDAPDEGVFALVDDDGEFIALRYDLTAPLARFVAQNRQELPTPFRRYQYGPVWRREKPGPGRFRQFYQCDFDTVGSASTTVDAEACLLLSTALSNVGLGPDQHEIRVNNRKVLTGILARSGVADEAKQLEVLRSIDKLDRLGRDAVAELLGPGRTDASGDVTEGAHLDDAQIDLVLRFIDAGQGGTSREEVLANLVELVGDDEIGLQGCTELADIDRYLVWEEDGPVPQVVFDPTVVRGLAYYTGPVFEAALTFETLDEKGRPRQFGSVAGGGRYDDLVTRFTGQAVPACGASIGVDRLLAALRSRASAPAEKRDLVVVTVMDRNLMQQYLDIVRRLRAAGERVELYQGTQGFQKQLRYADRRGAAVAVIVGGDEWANRVVQIKDLAAGEERAKEITDRDEYRTDRTAQRTVPDEELVAAVKAITRR
jgi:histidyl-tRNA synthetase